MVGWPSNAWTGEGWPDLLVWLSPHLFGMEVKQGKAHATPRQLARLVWLRKHRVHAWIVRSPQEALTIIHLALEGLSEMTFNDDLLSELDAALNGGPVAAVEAVPEELPEFNFEPSASPYTEEHHKAVETVTRGRKPTVTEAVQGMTIQEEADADQIAADNVPTAVPDAALDVVEAVVEATVDLEASNDALTAILERMVMALEASVLEMVKLNANVALLRGDVEAVAAVEAEPVQTAASPAPRRTKSGRVKLEAVPATEEISL